MVLKEVNWVHIDKIRSYGLERSQFDIQYKNQVLWSWKESIGYTMIKLGQMVLKGVKWVHIDKIRSNGIERGQLGIECKNQVIWSWKESKGYTLIKWRNQVIWSQKETITYTLKMPGHIVLEGVNLVQNAKIKWNGLERSQFSKLGIQC